MTTTTTTKLTDRDIQLAVGDELSWTPDVDHSDIGVSVSNGVVILSGEVKSYSERIAAKNAALRVHGVLTVEDELVVGSGAIASDDEVAHVVQAILRASALRGTTVQAEVHDHVVVLTGSVDWNFQRAEIKQSVQRLIGVREVDSRINLNKRASTADADQAIRRALVRNAVLDADAITVTVSGDEARLTGRVRSYAEKKAAGLAAWSSPNVARVANDLTVSVF